MKIECNTELAKKELNNMLNWLKLYPNGKSAEANLGGIIDTETVDTLYPDINAFIDTSKIVPAYKANLKKYHAEYKRTRDIINDVRKDALKVIQNYEDSNQKCAKKLDAIFKEYFKQR